jgi:hypothetical protein
MFFLRTLAKIHILQSPGGLRPPTYLAPRRYTQLCMLMCVILRTSMAINTAEVVVHVVISSMACINFLLCSNICESLMLLD